MITVRNVHKSFGTQVLFEGANLQINAGDRYALIGPNGAGKSTLMKMLLSEEWPDDGEISFKRGVAVGYLPQENAPMVETTVLAEALSNHTDPDGKVTAKCKTILMGLGFKVEDFERKVNTLSGGWAMRVAMARLLIEEPDLLMLDEPTNHLDLDSLLWFQEYLKYYRGAIFLISHDRNFINEVSKAIISVEERQLKVYHGNYEFFLNEKAAARERIETEYRAQQEEIADMQEFINRNRSRASTASRAQSMIKRLEKLERIELPEEAKKIRIKFPQPERTGVRVMTLKNLRKSYGSVKVYDGLDFELEREWKMAFVGHNGAGKSTLMKILAGSIPFDSGERNLGINVKVGYFTQHRAEMMSPEKTVLQEAMEANRKLSDQMVRSVLGSFLFTGQSVFKQVKVLSGGEKSRLALVKILLDPPNVLLMDEPTTHLDLNSIDALIAALKDFEGTLCVISHDLYFLNAIANHVVHVDHGKVTVYPGNYEYFQHRQKQNQAESAAAGKSPEGGEVQSPKLDREAAQSELRQKKKRIEELKKELSNPDVAAEYLRALEMTQEIETLESDVRSLKSSLGG